MDSYKKKSVQSEEDVKNGLKVSPPQFKESKI